MLKGRATVMGVLSGLKTKKVVGPSENLIYWEMFTKFDPIKNNL